jgi:uncharacterized protein (TIGR03435 family)
MVQGRLLGAVGIVAVVGGIAGVRAVQQALGSPVFTVASIRANPSGGPTMSRIQPGGRYTATNTDLSALIRNAYRLQRFQLVGGPSWLGTEHFDIVAKADGDLFSSDMVSSAPRPLELALRALLADRFQLVAHQETRPLPIYALVLSRADGRLGPKLTRSTSDCAAQVAATRAGAPPPPPPARGQAPPCGAAMGRGRLLGDSLPLSILGSLLSPSLDRMIVDWTGLTGTFNLDLTWQSDQPLPGSPGADAVAADPDAPSIFTAVQEQLGLKLEATTGPVDVLVIDHVEHPSED